MNFFCSFSFACDSCPTSNGFPIKTETIEEAQQRLKRESPRPNQYGESGTTRSRIVPDRGPSQSEIDQMNNRDLEERQGYVNQLIERNTKTSNEKIIELETQRNIAVKLAKEKEANDKSNLIKKFKEKCASIGFEMNTPKNGKCVLELMK